MFSPLAARKMQEIILMQRCFVLSSIFEGLIPLPAGGHVGGCSARFVHPLERTYHIVGRTTLYLSQILAMKLSCFTRVLAVQPALIICRELAANGIPTKRSV